MRPNFGMCEMEVAAEIIIQNAKNANSWDINIRYNDFGDSHSLASDGFLQLLANGWLAPNYVGGKNEFKVTPQFVKRVEETCGNLELPTPIQWCPATMPLTYQSFPHESDFNQTPL